MNKDNPTQKSPSNETNVRGSDNSQKTNQTGTGNMRPGQESTKSGGSSHTGNR
jgi:hypothetical protein